MRKSIYKKSTWDVLRSAILPVAFTMAIIGMIIYGLSQTEISGRAEAVRILEDSIRRAVVMSYAVEGRYPDTVAYIEDRYGVFIDRDKFVVHYMVFASNLMPDIMVIEK